MLTVTISGKNINFLYDPGSEYTILPKHLYDSLPMKPPLLPMDQFGVCINKSKFRFDGIAYLQLTFNRQDSSVYELPYEPVLVSSQISQAIFGIHTELRFKSVYRNNDNNELIFSPPDAYDINIKYFSENKSGVNAAYIQVSKATILKDKQITFLQDRVTSTKLEGEKHVFEGTDSFHDIEFADLKLSGCVTNSLTIPVVNTSGNDVLLKNGEIVGCINEIIECSTDKDQVNVSVGEVARNLDIGNNMTKEQKNKFDMIINKYDECMKKTPANLPCKIPIEHRIDLIDDSPVSLPPQRIPYNKRTEVESKVNELIENDFVEPSTSAYRGGVTLDM